MCTQQESCTCRMHTESTNLLIANLCASLATKMLHMYDSGVLELGVVNCVCKGLETMISCTCMETVSRT